MSNNLYHNLAELARKGGFTLCDGGDEKIEAIDWRFIASIDTARIVKESDFEKLDQCIPFLIRSSIGNLLNVRILDPAIARIYIISQLSLQYLLFCTKFLDKSVYSLRENIFNYQKKTVQLEELLVKRDEEIEQLNKKIKRHDQQIFACTKCTKNFLSAALLENHMQRKHPPVQESKDKDSHLINTIKLELEIKQLKERLNVTEKELMDVARKEPVECEKCKKNAAKIFQSVAIQSNFEEKEKDDYEKDAISEMLDNQMRSFEEWKQQTEQKYHSEIAELRGKLETIGKVQPVQPPSPAPRRLTITEKPEKMEETLWKARYQELEKMYEANQQRMALTVKSIEATYNEKMTKFENSVKVLTEEREKIREDLERKSEEIERKKLENEKKSVKIVDSVKKTQIPLTPKITVRKQESSTESSASDTESEIEEIKIASRKIQGFENIQKASDLSHQKALESRKIHHKTSKPAQIQHKIDDFHHKNEGSSQIHHKNSEIHHTDSESSETNHKTHHKTSGSAQFHHKTQGSSHFHHQTHQKPSDPSQIHHKALLESHQKAQETSQPNQKPKSIMETFAAQKFLIRPRKSKSAVKSSTTVEQPQKPLENSREKAEKLFNERLEAIGITQNSERMGAMEFETIYDKLVTKRQETKSKNKSFFITRKNLKMKVEKIFNKRKSKSEGDLRIKKTTEMEKDEMKRNFDRKQLNFDNTSLNQNKTTSIRVQKGFKVDETSNSGSKIPIPEPKSSVSELKASNPKVLFSIPTKSFSETPITYANSPHSSPITHKAQNLQSPITYKNSTPQSPITQKPSKSKDFQDDLEKLLAKRISTSNLKKPTNEDEEKLPTKSKKVLFNMKNLENPQKVENIKEVNEDDSDFDISSFSNFTADEDK